MHLALYSNGREFHLNLDEDEFALIKEEMALPWTISRVDKTGLLITQARNGQRELIRHSDMVDGKGAIFRWYNQKEDRRNLHSFKKSLVEWTQNGHGGVFVSFPKVLQPPTEHVRRDPLDRLKKLVDEVNELGSECDAVFTIGRSGRVEASILKRVKL